MNDPRPHDFRARAEQARVGNALYSANRPAKAPAKAPPVERGERLATLARGDSEVRITWDEFEGKPYLSVRLWTKDTNGNWWPSKTGITIRRHELADFADGFALALDRAEQADRAA